MIKYKSRSDSKDSGTNINGLKLNLSQRVRSSICSTLVDINAVTKLMRQIQTMDLKC